MTQEQSFCKHMAKVYLTQARAFRVRSVGTGLQAKSWHSFLLNVCGKYRRKYLQALRDDRIPVVIHDEQLSLF